MGNRLNFTLTQLEYVIALHKLGHFAKAADQCGVTQPTLSMQIQKLETELGVIIFDRSKKPILLTDQGKLLIEQMQTVLFEAQQISHILFMHSHEEAQGLIKLGIIPTLAPYLLPRLLPFLSKKHPQMKLQISEMQTQQTIQSLENDEIDVALLAIPLNIKQIQEKSLFFEPFFLLCQKGHPLSRNKYIKYSELRYPDIWLLTEGHCLRNQILDICALKQNRNQQNHFQFESGSLETLKNIIDSSGGYTLIPELAIDIIGKKSQLIAFEKPRPAREIGLVYRRKHYKSQLISTLMNSIKSCLPESLKKNRSQEFEILPPYNEENNN